MHTKKLGWIESAALGVHGALIASNPIILITLFGLAAAPLKIFNWNPWYYPIPAILWILLPFLLFIDNKDHPYIAWGAIVAFGLYHIAWIIFFALDENEVFLEIWVSWLPHTIVCFLTTIWITKKWRRTSGFR